MVDVFKMIFVLLLMSSLLLFCDARCNNCSVENSKVLNSDYLKYYMDKVDLSGDYMVVGIKGRVNHYYYRYEYRYWQGYNYYLYNISIQKESVNIYKRVNSNWIQEFETSNLTDVKAVAINNGHMAFISRIDHLTSVSFFRRNFNYNYSGNYTGNYNGKYTWVNQSCFTLPTMDHYSMAITDDTLVVGLKNYMANSSVYVFMNKGDSWSLQTDLYPTNNTTFLYYGAAVDVDGYYIVVGGVMHNYGGINSPSVSIFRNEKNTFVEEVRIFPSDRINKLSYYHYQYFGKSVTIDGDRVAVGDISDSNRYYYGYYSRYIGAVYVYKRVNGTWINDAKLMPSDGRYGDYFGFSVSLSGNYLVVGSKYNDVDGYNAGLIYIYKYIGQQWVEQVILTSSDVTRYQSFGSTVVVDGNYIAAVKGYCNYYNYNYYYSNCSVYTYNINDILNAAAILTPSPRDTTQNPKMSMTLQCDDLSMTAYWPRKSFFGHNISATMIDSRCNDIKSNVSMFWMTVFYNSCGTGIEEDEINILIYNTAFVSLHTSPNSIISRVENYEYNMLCLFPRERKLSLFNGYSISNSSGPRQIINTSVIAEFKASINIYDSSLFLQKSTYPVEVTLNQPMYIGVEKNPNPNVTMVVRKCFATTSPSIYGESYVFFLDKCPLDNTFKVVDIRDNKFNFIINAFRFIKMKKAIFLHCAVLFCKQNSTSAKCKQGCTNRKRRDIYVSAPGQPGLQYITTGRIVYLDGKSCIDIANQCPANSVCVDLYPPVCRCKDGFILSKHNTCIKERIIKFKELHIAIKWNNAYNDRHSKVFIRFAFAMEIKLYRLFVEMLGIYDIVGVKVISARPGSVLLDFSLLYSVTSSKENVAGELVRKMQENSNSNNLSSFKGFQDLHILLDRLPTLEQEETLVLIDNLTVAVGVCIPIAVLTLIVGCVYLYKHWNRKHVSVKPQ